MNSCFQRIFFSLICFLSLSGSMLATGSCDQCQVAALYVRHRPSCYRPDCCTPYYRYYPYPNYYYRYSTEYYHMRYPYSYDTHPHWWWYGGGSNVH